MYVDVGPGSDQGTAPQFGWDHAQTHRVEALEGGGTLLWINDRCFIVMAGMIPFPMCGIGKIPVRGDLFDHMRDSRGRQGRNANTTAPVSERAASAAHRWAHASLRRSQRGVAGFKCAVAGKIDDG